MRLHKSQTLIYQIIDFFDQDVSCSNKCQHSESCKSYVDVLKNENNIYNTDIKKKTCYKLAFFNQSFKNETGLSSLSDENFLGYITVHRDLLIPIKGRPGSGDIQTYMPQCFLRSPLGEGNFCIPKERIKLEIENEKIQKEFFMDGHYFAQKNQVTNNCAHAAIKMALRSRFPETNAEKINSIMKINHVDSKANLGLRPREFKYIIENISKKKLTTYGFAGSQMDSFDDFWQTVYYALESRFPVILLTKQPFGAKVVGHALTLIGHTLNEHSWWSYGTKGRAGLNIEEFEYMSSLIWCDNFIIQDERMGPYYLLPVRFIRYAKDQLLATKRKRLIDWIVTALRNIKALSDIEDL